MTTTLIKPTKQPIDIDSAPRNAFLFAVTAEITDTLDSGEGAKVLKVKLQLVARTKAVIWHWYWGPVVHDFAGMTHRDRLAVDLQHEFCEPIGYVDGFSVTDEGLVLDGYLVAVIGAEDDKGMEVILRGQAGIPYQASIDFDPESVVLEYVPEGFTSEANGQTYSGPVTIIRQWELQGVAVCLRPWDAGTEARFSKDAKDAPQVPLNWKDKGKFAMTTTNTNPETKPADKPAESIDDVRGQFAQTQKKFVGMFGAVDGNEYLAAGKPYETALEEHVGKLSKQVGDEKTRADEAEAKLKAALFAHGEPSAIDTSAKGGKGDGTKAAAGLLGMIKPKGRQLSNQKQSLWHRWICPSNQLSDQSLVFTLVKDMTNYG